jgi:hypothetical protein
LRQPKTIATIEMTPSQHLKQCFRFWKPTVARRITLYFTLFGLLVFYLTSVGHLVAAKKNLVGTATRMVQSEIGRIPGSSQPDFWWGALDRPSPSWVIWPNCSST